MPTINDHCRAIIHQTVNNNWIAKFERYSDLIPALSRILYESGCAVYLNKNNTEFAFDSKVDDTLKNNWSVSDNRLILSHINGFYIEVLSDGSNGSMYEIKVCNTKLLPNKNLKYRLALFALANNGEVTII